jgi:hypothetical protein
MHERNYKFLYERLKKTLIKERAFKNKVKNYFSLEKKIKQELVFKPKMEYSFWAQEYELLEDEIQRNNIDFNEWKDLKKFEDSKEQIEKVDEIMRYVDEWEGIPTEDEIENAKQKYEEKQNGEKK